MNKTDVKKNFIAFASTKKIVSQHLYTYLAKRKIKTCGVNLKVNHRCVFSGNISVSDHCNFNGIKIIGGG